MALWEFRVYTVPSTRQVGKALAESRMDIHLKAIEQLHGQGEDTWNFKEVSKRLMGQNIQGYRLISGEVWALWSAKGMQCLSRAKFRTWDAIMHSLNLHCHYRKSSQCCLYCFCQISHGILGICGGEAVWVVAHFRAEVTLEELWLSDAPPLISLE